MSRFSALLSMYEPNHIDDPDPTPFPTDEAPSVTTVPFSWAEAKEGEGQRREAPFEILPEYRINVHNVGVPLKGQYVG